MGHPPLRADLLIVEVRGTHPFAKNAKGWGTLVYTVPRKGWATRSHSPLKPTAGLSGPPVLHLGVDDGQGFRLVGLANRKRQRLPILRDFVFRVIHYLALHFVGDFQSM